MVEKRTARQATFYDRGLGTGKLEILAATCGIGISNNILECYRFIYDNYNEGDRIFLFGFSRGAATVRSLAGFIELFGMLPPSRPELIAKAYKIYTIKDRAARLNKADEFLTVNCGTWCNIHFVGVFDTVAALGLPLPNLSAALDKIPYFRHEFHDLGLSPRITTARHALAIDERRKTFLPTLWDELPRPAVVRYWSTVGSKPIRLVQGPVGPVHGLTVTDDGKFVITASDDNTAKIWDARPDSDGGKPWRVLEGHTAKVNSVALTRDGTRIITGSDDATVRIWMSRSDVGSGP